VTLAVCLVIVAFGLVMAEVAIPSFGMLSLMAAAAYAVALWKAFEVGVAEGIGLIGAGLMLLPVAIGIGFRVLPKPPIGRRLILAHPGRSAVQHGTRPEELKSLIGHTGIAVTDLRPAGTARVGDRRIDVVAGGRFLTRGSPLVVVKVDGTRVVVRGRTEDKKGET